ncbi:MAG: VOC family protein [Deltaproteobacteria bacterium]|nr:VOC family protein [Deltaproteobacteria bacterium]
MTTASRPPLLGIRHVALFTPELDAAERFWVDIMGYAVEWRPDADNVYLTCGRDNLALHRRAVDKGLERLDHVGLAVPAPGDVDAWAERLRGHGIALQTEPRTHRDGARSFYFREPGGALVQIIHHAPISSP